MGENVFKNVTIVTNMWFVNIHVTVPDRHKYI